VIYSVCLTSKGVPSNTTFTSIEYTSSSSVQGGVREEPRHVEALIVVATVADGWRFSCVKRDTMLEAMN